MAVVTLDVRLFEVWLDCEGCGRPGQLTRSIEREDPERVARDHSRATGHRCSVRKVGVSYITVTAGPLSKPSGPLPWR